MWRWQRAWHARRPYGRNGVFVFRYFGFYQIEIFIFVLCLSSDSVYLFAFHIIAAAVADVVVAVEFRNECSLFIPAMDDFKLKDYFGIFVLMEFASLSLSHSLTSFLCGFSQFRMPAESAASIVVPFIGIMRIFLIKIIVFRSMTSTTGDRGNCKEDTDRRL